MKAKVCRTVFSLAIPMSATALLTACASPTLAKSTETTIAPVRTVASAQISSQMVGFRPPSVPLIAHDPYFSVWSNADRLTDDATRHWTGAKQPLSSLIRIDNQTFRLLGATPNNVPAMRQTSLKVLPTRTVATFDNAQVQVVLTFTSPGLPDDLEVLSRPVTYVSWRARSLDGKTHAIAAYFSAGGELAVNAPEQQVVWSRQKAGNMTALRIGTQEQNIMGRAGDDVRLDWGYLYLAAPRASQATLGEESLNQSRFISNTVLPNTDDTRMPRAANDAPVSAALVLPLGKVGATAVEQHALIAYDDVYSINYFGRFLRPYWRRNGMTPATLLPRAESDYNAVMLRCVALDNSMMADATQRGGAKYAALAALAYRQCLAANKLVADANGQPLMFSKENNSNGSIGTTDILYPMLPQFLLTSPLLAKATVMPMLQYASSPRWKFPFAPHDIGTYPNATGQTYGAGENGEDGQMPVEESGNMLLCVGAIAHVEGNTRFADPYWRVLTQWADYLVKEGYNPENQLTTDDFAGHAAHNVNLSAKAIVALGAYAKMCAMRGDLANAQKYRAVAQDYANRWVRDANDGDHFRLAFDQPGTWSQKYNMIWDRVLDLRLFPAAAVAKEVAFYRTKLNPYGLPLDSRKAYTKTDWSVWTASLATDRASFDAIIAPVYRFANETPDRVPFSDWYWTDSGKQTGFKARPVIGGLFMPMLTDMSVWKKWAARGAKSTENWAAQPVLPPRKDIVAASQSTGLIWRYTTTQPTGNWTSTSYDDSSWKTAPAPFGAGTGGVRTPWNTPDLWIRRQSVVPAGTFKSPQVWLQHDEDTEVYFNGVLAATAPGYNGTYQGYRISPQGMKQLKPGPLTIAAHVHQTGGGQFLDVGIADVPPPTLAP